MEKTARAVQFGKTIRNLREQRNLSLRQLARSLGVHSAYLSKVENGKVSPSEKLIEKLATFFHAPYLYRLAGRAAPAAQYPQSFEVQTNQNLDAAGCLAATVYPENDPFADRLEGAPGLEDDEWQEFYDAVGLEFDLINVTPIIRYLVKSAYFYYLDFDSMLCEAMRDMEQLYPNAKPKLDRVIYAALAAGSAQGQNSGLKHAYEILVHTLRTQPEWFFGSFFARREAEALFLFHQLLQKNQEKQARDVIVEFLRAYLTFLDQESTERMTTTSGKAGGSV